MRSGQGDKLRSRESEGFCGIRASLILVPPYFSALDSPALPLHRSRAPSSQVREKEALPADLPEARAVPPFW